ncbi:hypothetical protein IPC755_28655 [Pseudomonas aeruginosa]|jgi:hypothetical protein|uniref:hypothetical protein n=1 Tax=Pseudomonas aeruginosa TaxID=287 RepID=UPI000FC4015D|nr:hypothetical protein [Pseudomonas aeruginosa]RUG38125.1 hypothetical protein IPC755_28655 [Pseudomonas aeruginosa]HBO0923608.1 hypothetical protein [Pseudomonas aeruginosa]HBO1888404.1 hypothetical protein [Pseudomonas aeruginosa]HEJ1837313.1 hypothetical protein [Pseudomonas aeruginosa]HEK3577566.1 hypothetical protein [Pseudomonas aeruginosa]
MSQMFLAQIKHKLIKAESVEFKELTDKDSNISLLASAAKFLVRDTGFKLVGFAPLDAKSYFFFHKFSQRYGDIEIPISTDMMGIFKDASDDLQIHRIKKALKRDDLPKFQMELQKFADSQMQNLEVTFL